MINEHDRELSKSIHLFISILLQNYKINSSRSKLYTFCTFSFVSSHNYLHLKLDHRSHVKRITETRKRKKKKKGFFQRRPNNK